MTDDEIKGILRWMGPKLEGVFEACGVVLIVVPYDPETDEARNAFVQTNLDQGSMLDTLRRLVDPTTEVVAHGPRRH